MEMSLSHTIKGGWFMCLENESDVEQEIFN